MDLNNIIDIIKQLENTSSSNEKIKIMKKNKDNKLFIKILHYTYNDMKFGVTRDTIVLREGNSKFEDLFDLLDCLAESNINDNLRIEIGRFLNKLDEDEKELVIRILTKDLRVGISVKSINKAIPGTIVTHDIQLAGKWEGNDLKKEMAVSLKLDGIRCSFLIENGTIVAKTRQNKTIEGMGTLENEILKICGDRSLFLDGELLAINREGLDSKNLFKKTSKIVNSKGKKEGLMFVAFDILPLEDYKTKITSIPFKERRKMLEEIVDNNCYIEVAPLYFITDDANKVREKLDEVVSLGLEGLILNDLEGKYKFTRNRDGLLKVKKFYTMDLKIIGFEEGQGKNKETLGAILVDFKGNTVKVGSGLSDDNRIEIWNNQDKYLGRILEVSYFEITKDKTGKESLRFPTFVRIREKGKNVSYD